MKKLINMAFLTVAIIGMVGMNNQTVVSENEIVKTGDSLESIKVHSETDKFKEVIFDPYEQNYYLMTYNWALSLDEYYNHDYDEKLLAELNQKYKNSEVKIFYKDYENIVGYFIAYEN